MFIITPQYALSGAVAMRTCAMPRAVAAAFADMPITPSRSPLRSPTSWVFSSLRKRTTMRGIAGAPCQYVALAASSIRSPRAQRTARNGPVPTGAPFSGDCASDPPRSRCAGAR